MSQTNIIDMSSEQNEIARDGLDYEPSIQVKRSFLPLRKNIRLWGGVKFPGLFDHDPANDAAWFWFTVAMEVVSLGIAAFLLEERVSATVLLISALSVFFLDFACAYFHHKYKSMECLIKNQMCLFLQDMRVGASAVDSFANYYAYLEQKLKDDKNRKYTRYFFGFMIWLLSLIKGGIFFIAVFSSYWFQTAVSDSKAPYLLIFVIIASYFWIASNHINFSGYYLAAVANKNQLKSELIKYKRNLYSTSDNDKEKKEEKVYFNFSTFLNTILAEKDNTQLASFSRKNKEDFERELHEGLVEATVKAGTHHIKKVENQEGDYIFRRKGFITDEQIHELVKAQKNQLAELAVAMYFHKLQMASANFTGAVPNGHS
jgi:hypothetical protein